MTATERVTPERAWEGLNPPYRTIVADPPWAYNEGWPKSNGQGQRGNRERRALAYSSMSVQEIQGLQVRQLAATDARLFLWTTSRYLFDAFDVLAAWDFAYSQTLVWCKPPRGLGPGGTFATTAEFVLVGQRGKPGRKGRVDSSWWMWPRVGHSTKPSGFLDVVEASSRGPYVELFARAPRLGWDSWGYGYEEVV